MKIAIVHSFYSSGLPSGENNVVLMQAEALQEAGHEVQLVEARTDDFVEDKLYPLRAALNIVRGSGIDPTPELRAFEPDVTHVHNLFPNFATSWLNKWHGPIVSTVHNFRPVCASGILFRDGEQCTLCPDGSQLNAIKYSCYRDSKVASIPLAIRNRRGVNSDALLTRSDALIFLSGRSKRQYADFGFRPKDSTVLPNFVETPDMRPSNNPSPEWIYVGRIAPEKGVVKMLDVWPEDQIINVFGDGPDASKLASIARPNIRIHGLKSRDEILEIMPSARGLVLPSTCAENFPTVYAEALAAGIPVVAKAGNAAADDLSNTNVGQVFDDWADLPAALESVAKLRHEMSQEARRRFDNNFTRERWISQVLPLYTSAIETVATGRPTAI